VGWCGWLVGFRGRSFKRKGGSQATPDFSETSENPEMTPNLGKKHKKLPENLKKIRLSPSFN
jgi:hypothetical protein